MRDSPENLPPSPKVNDPLRPPLKAAISLAFLLAALVLVITFLPLPRSTILWRQVMNTGHDALFMLVAPVVLMVLRSGIPALRQQPKKSYAAAFLVCLAFAVISELIQVPLRRDASLSDIAGDTSGTVAGLALASLVDRQLPRQMILRALAIVAAVGAFVYSLTPIAMWTVSYLDRDRAFPLIESFEPRWFPAFTQTRRARLDLVPAGHMSPPFGSGHVGKVTFHAGRWPRLSILEPAGSWAGFEYLVMEVLNTGGEPRQFGIRISDAAHNGRFEDRYNGRQTIAPGPASVRIPLTEVRRAPVSRQLDLGRISEIIIFADQPEQAFELYFDNIRLE